MCIYIYLSIYHLGFQSLQHNGPEIPSWCRRATVEQFWPREGHDMMDETEKTDWTQFETNSLVICCFKRLISTSNPGNSQKNTIVTATVNLRPATGHWPLRSRCWHNRWPEKDDWNEDWPLRTTANYVKMGTLLRITEKSTGNEAKYETFG